MRLVSVVVVVTLLVVLCLSATHVESKNLAVRLAKEAMKLKKLAKAVALEALEEAQLAADETESSSSSSSEESSSDDASSDSEDSTESSSSSSDSSDFSLTSEALLSTGYLDETYTCFADDWETPPAQWTGAPAATKSFVVLFYQPSDSDTGTASHVFWLQYNIDSSVSALEANTSVGTMGLSSANTVSFYPPCSGPGATRTFYMKVYALNVASIFDDTEVTSAQAFTDTYSDNVLSSASLELPFVAPGRRRL